MDKKGFSDCTKEARHACLPSSPFNYLFLDSCRIGCTKRHDMKPQRAFCTERGRRLSLPFLLLLLFVASSSVFCAEGEADSNRPLGFQDIEGQKSLKGDAHTHNQIYSASPNSWQSSPSEADTHTSSDQSFKSAKGSARWSNPSGSDVSSPRSPNGFGRLEDGIQFSSPSPSGSGHSSSSDEIAAAEAVYRGRLRASIKAKNIMDDVKSPALSTFEVGESSAAAAAAAAPRGDTPIKEPPVALLAESFKDPANQQSKDGVPDVYLRNPANQHIKEAIKRLPQSRDYYQLVAMADPAAPGGYRVYRYYNEPYAALHYEQVPYNQRFLYRLKDLENEAHKTALDTPDYQRKLRTIGWRWKGRPADLDPTEPLPPREFVRPIPGNTLQKAKQAFLSKFADQQWKMRTHLSDIKDAIAVGKDRRLANYHTTGGIAALYGREEFGIGKTIPPEARRIAQELGQVHVFYDWERPQDQVRVAYTGPLRPPGRATPLAPPEDFRAYVVPPNRALPLPKHWRDAGLDEQTKTVRALMRMNEAENGEWRTMDIRDRWPAKWEQKTADLRAKLQGWQAKLKQKQAEWRAQVQGRPRNLRDPPRSSETGNEAAGEAGSAGAEPTAEQQMGRSSRGWRQALTGAWNKATGRWTSDRQQVATPTPPNGPTAPAEQTAASRTWSHTLSDAARRVKQATSSAKDKLAGLVRSTPSTSTVVTENAQHIVAPMRRRRRR